MLMSITRTSPFTGVEHTQEISVSHRQLAEWRAGGLIQNVMTHLTPDEREFIMTGITAEEWEDTFGNDKDTA